MAEGDVTNNDAADAGTESVVNAIEEGDEGQWPTSGAEATGADPAGSEPSSVGDAATEGGGGGEGSDSRPGDWNPGEQSGGGGELY